MSSQYNSVERFNDNNNVNGNRGATNQKQTSHHLMNLPQIFLFDNGPIEATGLALNSIARGLVGMSSLFLGPALLILAQEAAKEDCNNNNNTGEEGCNNNDDDDDEGRVYGMRPSSLLTNIGVFSGLFSALMLPLFGAIVDHTPYRKDIGQWSAIILSIIKGVEIFLGKSTWFYIAILQVVNYVLYQAHLCASYAYTAELSTDPDEQTTYNARFQIINYISMLAFLITVTSSSALLNVQDVGQARISQTLAFIGCSLVFGFAWKYFFRSRPALRQVPSHSTLLTAGFRKLSNTFAHIIQNWYALR